LVELCPTSYCNSGRFYTGVAGCSRPRYTEQTQLICISIQQWSVIESEHNATRRASHWESYCCSKIASLEAVSFLCAWAVSHPDGHSPHSLDCWFLCTSVGRII